MLCDCLGEIIGGALVVADMGLAFFFFFDLLL